VQPPYVRNTRRGTATREDQQAEGFRRYAGSDAPFKRQEESIALAITQRANNYAS
jgi:hypothetical protein